MLEFCYRRRSYGNQQSRYPKKGGVRDLPDRHHLGDLRSSRVFREWLGREPVRPLFRVTDPPCAAGSGWSAVCFWMRFFTRVRDCTIIACRATCRPSCSTPRRAATLRREEAGARSLEIIASILSVLTLAIRARSATRVGRRGGQRQTRSCSLDLPAFVATGPLVPVATETVTPRYRCRRDPAFHRPVRNAIERLHEEFKRRIKTQTVPLLASGKINMRKVDRNNAHRSDN